MTDDPQAVAAAIRKFLLAVKGLAALESEMENLGSVQRAAIEATTRLSKVQADVETEQGHLAAVKAEVGTLRSEADALRKRVNAEADVTAREIAEKTRSARHELDTLNADITQREARLAEIEAQMAALRERL